MQKNGAEDWTLGINKDRGMALKFQSKMRLVYIVLGIMSSFILGYLYYSTSMDKIYRPEMSSLTVSVEQLKNQYDEMIETMKDVSYYLLSDPDIMHNFWNFPDVSQQAVSKIRTESFNRHLATLRIEKAKEIMEDKPDLFIKDIAAMVGFSDQFYFSRIFHSITGMSPAEYMKNHKGISCDAKS